MEALAAKLALQTIDISSVSVDIEMCIRDRYWNYDKALPGKFFYQTDSFLAVYEYDAKRDEPEWSIYRLKKVMALGEE